MARWIRIGLAAIAVAVPVVIGSATAAVSSPGDRTEAYHLWCC